MAERPVAIAGAGASFHAGAPGLRTVLANAIATEGARLTDLVSLLEGFFRWTDRSKSPPSLPFVLGVVDTALDRGESLGPDWEVERLREVRRQIEYGIFSILNGLEDEGALYQRLVAWLDEAPGEPTIVSLNYDVLADAAMVVHQQVQGRESFPDYGCEVATEGYVKTEKYGRLFKLVGSLNWTHCPSCHRLDARFHRNHLPSAVETTAGLLLDPLAGPGELGTCSRRDCEATLRPVIVSPTPVEGEWNPHIAQARYAAERALLEADAVIFIGYRMNLSDLALTYLIKRALAGLPSGKITVVGGDWPEHLPDQYRDAFGPSTVWTGQTFAEWLGNTEPVASY